MPTSTAPERIWTSDDGEEATDFTRLPYLSSPTDMTFPATRPSSPPSIFPLRFNSQPWDANSPDMSYSSRSGRQSVQSTVRDKGKEPLRGDSLLDSASSNGNTGPESMRTHHASATPFTTYDRVRSSTADRGIGNGFNSRRNRGSILGAASDALGFKFGRKRPIIRQVPLPVILPDVIEISAPPPDQEVEERNRLREMAAQAIGISPYMARPDSYSQEDSTEDEDEDILRTPVDNSELRRFGDARNSESAPDFANKYLLDTNLSTPTTTTVLSPMRYRSGSMIAHTRNNSSTLAPIPSFPTNVLSLNPFLTCNGHFPKYNHPSSLRIFTLSSKNWKTRYIILSSPTHIVTKAQGPATSYLHLFKSSGPDDKELERLEINEDSVVFVADEDVGGRRNVIKVGGLDVGIGSKEGTREGERTMWHLQIADAAESQRWISSIKNAILGQRTVRAGLGVPSTPIGFEPRGDLDVMLSIRAQGLATSLKSTPLPAAIHDVSSQVTSHHDRTYASSISSRSIRSQVTVPKPSPSGAVSTLKGLFSSRPRSSSRATVISVDSERQLEADQRDGSFTSIGNNLLKLRTNGADTQPNTPIQQRNTLPFAPPIPFDHRLDRKVFAERQPDHWITNPRDQTITLPVPVPQKQTRANRALSLGAASLQPPPRKRWGSFRPTSANAEEDLGFRFAQPDSAITAVFGARSSVDKAETEPPTSPVDFTSFSNQPYEKRPRAPSLQSVSTYASEKAMSADRSSASTKRSSGTNRRWSRQLPQRLTPPSGPPPDVPPSVSAIKVNVHPYGADRPPSIESGHSGQSQRSVVSSLPSFSKRTSSSSSRSAASSGATQNASNGSFGSLPSSGRPLSSHRNSMPPPSRPAPTTALPPAPQRDGSPPPMVPVPTPTKSSFRNSVAQRALRLSLIAPKPPPSSTLPPRPDEFEFDFRSHRRSSSSGKMQLLDTIPEPSKSPQLVATSPFPPPLGPLPPTPKFGVSATPPAGTTPPVSRHSSLKQRLRILSAPSPMGGTSSLPPTRPTTASSITPTLTPSFMHFTHSTPSTPITEKFSMFPPTDPPSFLQMNTPVMTYLPPPRFYDQRDDEDEAVELLDEVTSLSPPPRRGSRHVVAVELVTAQESPTTNNESDEQKDQDEPRPTTQATTTNDGGKGQRRVFSLSPPGSVVSLGLVNL